MDLDKPLALVTGGNRGIGYEVSRQLARKGFRVLLAARALADGEAAATRLQQEGLEVLFYPLDVTDERGAAELARFIREKFGRLDVLVNNAGILIDGPPEHADRLLDGDIEALRATFEVNVLGPVRMAHHLAPLMEGSGQIVNVSSGMGQLSDMGTGSPAYRISKTALNAITRILAGELATTGVHVNAVCPGWVRTDMGGPGATRSPEQGADTIVWLATQGAEGPTGGFFRDRKQIPW